MIVRVESTLSVVVNGAGSSSAVTPAIVERHALFGFEASAVVARGTPSLALPEGDRHIHARHDACCHGNITRTNFDFGCHPDLERGRDVGSRHWRRCAVRRWSARSIVVDGGSSDETVACARSAGAQVIVAPRGRGGQLAAGAAAASGDWLLFLHADCRLEPGWERAVDAFLTATGSGTPRRLLRFGARRSGAGSAAAGAHRRLALPGSGAALWRPGTADRPHASTTRSAALRHCR